jgi:tight adherence protein B
MELLIAGMVFGAVTLVIWAVIQSRAQQQFATQTRLDRIAGRASGDWTAGASTFLRGSRISSIRWLDEALGQMDFVRWVEVQLMRADWNVRVSEFLGFMGVLGALGFLAGTLLLGSPLIGIALAAIAAVVPIVIIRRAVSKRRRVLEQQLVEMLVMVSNSLKAGFGLMQGLDQAANQLEDPIAKELKGTIRATQVGQSVEDAVQALSARVGSYDLEIVATAILVQRNVGGNLSEILDGVAHTMRERERIRGEISTLTAQQRLTGFVIAGLPPALGVVFFLLNPEYMMTLFTEQIGRYMVAGAIVLELIGAYVIKRIISIDI